MNEPSQSIWEGISPERRIKLIKGIWFVIWGLLLIGLLDRTFYKHVVTVSLAQAILFMCLFSLKIRPFPVQTRIIYLIWVTIGTYVPNMTILMYITTIGLATNLFFNYCPLARLVYLLPWNNEIPLSLNSVKRVFFSPPVKGQFNI